MGAHHQDAAPARRPAQGGRPRPGQGSLDYHELQNTARTYCNARI